MLQNPSRLDQRGLVIANREENRRRDVERLEAAGIRVWVTYPQTVRDGVELLGELAELGAPEERRRAVVAPAMAALARAEQERIEPRPIVTDRIGLAQVPEAFQALAKPDSQCKVVVYPG